MASDATTPPPATPPGSPPSASPPPPPRPTAAGSPRWMRGLLVASLALNLLILGLVAGAVLHKGPRGPHPRPGEIALGPVAQALAPADRAAILRDLRGREDLRIFGPRERAAAFAGLGAALRADPFDAAAVEAALLAQTERLDRAEAAVRAVLLERFAAMDAAERAAFADRLAEEAAKGPGGRD